MFIQTEPTPNPATLKFIPGKMVLGDDTVDYRSKAEAAGSPLATRLFEIEGVTGVFLGSDFISVTKGDAEWPHIRPAILGAIMEHYMSGAPVVGSARRAATDCRAEQYDPKDEETVRTIKELLDTRVRPGGRQRRRRHHLPGLPGRRRLPAHARRLLRLPQLDGDLAPRHREPAPALLPRRAGGAARLDGSLRDASSADGALPAATPLGNGRGFGYSLGRPASAGGGDRCDWTTRPCSSCFSMRAR